MSSLFTRKTIIILAVITLFSIAAYFILPVSVPLIFALVTALFLEPAVRWVNRRFKITRNFSVLIVFLLFIMLIGAGSYFTLTKVIAEIINLGENLPQYITEINNIWYEMETDLVAASKDLPEEFVEEVSNQVEQLLLNMKNDLTNLFNIDSLKVFATNAVTGIPDYLVSVLVYLIALFLFLLELPRIKTRMYAHLTPKTADKVSFMNTRLSYVIFGFFKAQFLVSIIIFIATLIGLLLIKPEVALVMALIIWIIDFIPIIGSIVILGPWAIFHLLTGSIALGTKLAILAVLLLVIRRTVEPKVMGQHIGLSPLSTLISMYLGLQLLGILGFIIGPLLVIAFNSAREAGIIKLNFKI